MRARISASPSAKRPSVSTMRHLHPGRLKPESLRLLLVMQPITWSSRKPSSSFKRMIRFWEIERREEINITHKSLLRWNAVTNFYCIPMLFIHWQTRKNRDIQKYQYLDYQKINQLDVVKHNVKLLCDFYRLSPITKFAETGIHKHQYFDYQMTTHTSRNAMHGYLKHLLFPQKQSTRWLSVS